MAGPWDSNMKQLVRDFAQDYISFLVEGATFESELNAHLPRRSLDADTLIKVRRKRRVFLIHMEFQARNEKEMPLRVCEYNLQATRKYKLPVSSFVFYLQRDGTVPESPFVLRIPEGEEVHRFNYHPIEVYTISSDVLRQAGLPGLLPLLPLTRDGACQRVVEELIEDVEQVKDETKRKNLLTAGLNFASLAFGEKWRSGLVAQEVSYA